jgi:3-oxoacyl-[acyl-carrier-protein] synthase-3
MKNRASILDIASFLPDNRLDNKTLECFYQSWTAGKIFQKTGIKSRAIAGDKETAADLAFGAAKSLFAKGKVSCNDVDFIILCTQAPDYILPTTACTLQSKLGISTSAGALDVNLGCSGYVYCLSLAQGLILSGSARCVLVLTADTYSKYIHPMDKSVRTIFGDAATATAVIASEATSAQIGPFVFGTDGRGANALIVPAGGFRRPRDEQSSTEYTDASGNVRSANHLFMNGPEVMAFSLREVPKIVASVLAKGKITLDDVDYFVMHQANQLMLDALRKKMKISHERFPIFLENVGNTVSSTVPLTLEYLTNNGAFSQSRRIVLVGFGVGLSWAACILTTEGVKND